MDGPAPLIGGPGIEVKIIVTGVIPWPFSEPDTLGDLLRSNTLSVGVRRDMIFRSTLVTATTRTGKPCISFALNTAVGQVRHAAPRRRRVHH
jgi:hypothetical protein